MNTKRILLVGRICKEEFHWDIAPLPVVTETMLVSRYANRMGLADVQANYFLDGQCAAREGQPLAAMPTEYHEAGWWSANETQSARVRFDGSIEDDADFIRYGGA